MTPIYNGGKAQFGLLGLILSSLALHLHWCNSVDQGGVIPD